MNKISSGWQDPEKNEGELRRREKNIENSLVNMDISEETNEKLLLAAREFISYADDMSVIEGIQEKLGLEKSKDLPL